MADLLKKLLTRSKEEGNRSKQIEAKLDSLKTMFENLKYSIQEQREHLIQDYHARFRWVIAVSIPVSPINGTITSTTLAKIQEINDAGRYTSSIIRDYPPASIHKQSNSIKITSQSPLADNVYVHIAAANIVGGNIVATPEQDATLHVFKLVKYLDSDNIVSYTTVVINLLTLGEYDSFTHIAFTFINVPGELPPCRAIWMTLICQELRAIEANSLKTMFENNLNSNKFSSVFLIPVDTTGIRIVSNVPLNGILIHVSAAFLVSGSILIVLTRESPKSHLFELHSYLGEYTTVPIILVLRVIRQTYYHIC